MFRLQGPLLMDDDTRPRDGMSAADPEGRQKRADARRNLDSVLEAALAVFAEAGVDAPVRTIAERAGVGVGTVYRHFPQRSDLIVAVFRREVDACAGAATVLAAAHPPGEALARWMLRFLDFIAAKRGLAAALHSGDAAYTALPAYFDARLKPAFAALLDAAAAAGEIRPGVEPNDLLHAIASLSAPERQGGHDYGRRMVGLLIDGLRFGAPKAMMRAGTETAANADPETQAQEALETSTEHR
jgi:AcrR family transcriptional regulator